ncbi:hypothetical protein BDZ94DRAFT_48769 [Collybia nuda]|uniref:Uncharacterized protein n=1 Tax=Collybia nuda TaxID=64659 RepID=A0A9P6CRE8_9AGAR|nr:hypothetical protein BDZ94DRAFT_48769 [Collybia nuda]
MTRSHNEPPPTPTITLTNVVPAYSPAGRTAKGGPHRGGGPSASKGLVLGAYGWCTESHASKGKGW